MPAAFLCGIIADMTPSAHTTTEVPVKLRLTPEASAKLAQRAAQTGQDVADYASELIEHAVTKPTADELLAPFRRQVAESGISDEELDQFHEQLRDKSWNEKRSEGT